MKINENVVRRLSYLCKTYDGLTKQIAATKNRLQAMMPDAEIKHQEEIKEMESTKGKLITKIKHELEFWEVWTEWLVDVPGLGVYIAGNLILLYYYRFMPICTKCGGNLEKDGEGGLACIECGKKAKRNGVLNYKVEEKDFPKISSWWHYMGAHVVDGKAPKKAKGKICDWSSKGKCIWYQAATSFMKLNGGKNRDTSKYRLFYDSRRKKRDITHPEASNGHKMAMSLRETAKLFLSHFWQVARILDGKPLTTPYAEGILRHENIIPPYYFNHATSEAQ